MSNVIPVGANPKSQFCLYGDESRFRDVLVFAFAVFHRQDLERARGILAAIRNEYRVPPRIPIHCRVLFNSEARKKHGIDHLDQPAVNALVTDLVRHTTDVPAACRFAWTAFPDRDPLVDSSDPSWVLPSEPKGVIGLLMQACFAVAADGREGPPATESEIFVSADPTKIRFLGDRRYQAHRGYRGFSDVDSPVGHVFDVTPHVVPADRWAEQPLLQLADVFAYICSHADPSLNGDDFFTRLLKGMRWSRATLVLKDQAEPETITHAERDSSRGAG